MENVRKIFDGKLLKVSVGEETLPNGYRATFEMIKHPGAALVVPLLSRDKLILLRQLRPVIGAYIYELVAGTLGRDEKPLACARREIIEETGFLASKFTRLGEIYPVPGYSTEKIVIFKAEGLKKVERRPEADEIIETRVVSRSEVKRLLKRGKIVDAKTICALAMCGWI